MGGTVKNTLNVVIIMLLAGCGSSMNLEVTTEVPTATTTSSSIKTYLTLSSDFSQYVFREDSEARQNWEISLGESQTNLFKQVFASVFSDITFADEAPNDHAYSLVFQPRLVDMQLATPLETGFSFYEAWLNYAVILTRYPEASSHEIQITAYGKNNTARFQRLHQGLHQAIEKALRDAGAKLTLELVKMPEIRQSFVE